MQERDNSNRAPGGRSQFVLSERVLSVRGDAPLIAYSWSAERLAPADP
jgi:hypothetical protein